MIARLTICLFVSIATPLFGQTSFNGITEPASDAELSFPVSGVLAELPFREGEFVREGEVVGRLGNRREELEVSRRQLILDNAKMDLKRTQQLYDKTGSISEEELDEKRATVKVAETELAIAREDVNRRLLVAPFDGLIANLHGLDKGEGVELLTPVVRLVDASTCVFVCNLPANAAKAVKPEAKASIQIGEVNIPGFVTFISPVIEPSSGLLKVKARFENPERLIVPGAAGQLTFLE
ncbi:efflux RND transporter periplasmic adaptor subunit [bacterium]|nr:efflux RND transporter periplasmic adaptor subunit [bacterium]